MQHTVSFFEIPAEDFNRAVKFYSTIFNEELWVCECESEKMAGFKDGSGAISWSETFKPSPNGVLVHFLVDDINAEAKIIEANGGKIIIPRTKIEAEGRGWFATFCDTEGNTIGIYENLK